MAKDNTTKRYRLTKTFVEKIPLMEKAESGDNRFTYWDDRIIGFGVRVSPNTKTYIVYTRIKNRVHQMRL
jgi:hypothetical protein